MNNIDYTERASITLAYLFIGECRMNLSGRQRWGHNFEYTSGPGGINVAYLLQPVAHKDSHSRSLSAA